MDDSELADAVSSLCSLIAASGLGPQAQVALCNGFLPDWSLCKSPLVVRHPRYREMLGVSAPL